MNSISMSIVATLVALIFAAFFGVRRITKIRKSSTLRLSHSEVWPMRSYYCQRTQRRVIARAVTLTGARKKASRLREWEAALSASQGVKFVSRADYDAAISIASSVRSHLGATELLSNGFAEVAGILADYQGVNVRIKPDFRTSTAIVDLKDTQDARSDAFTRSVMNFGYDVQAALYVDVAAAIDGMKRDFYWVAVEKDTPYAVAVYKASDEMLQRGREQYTRAIELYKECAALDLWPAYSQQVQTIELPGWAK
jgi:homoserine acetyltransferase